MIGGKPVWVVTFACRCGAIFNMSVHQGTNVYPCPHCGQLAPMRSPCCPPWGWAR